MAPASDHQHVMIAFAICCAARIAPGWRDRTDMLWATGDVRGPKAALARPRLIVCTKKPRSVPRQPAVSSTCWEPFFAGGKKPPLGLRGPATALYARYAATKRGEGLGPRERCPLPVKGDLREDGFSGARSGAPRGPQRDRASVPAAQRRASPETGQAHKPHIVLGGQVPALSFLPWATSECWQ